MTLVVARLTPLGVRLSADMRISHPDAVHPPSFMDAALKIVVITPELALAYAGGVAAALDAIRAVASEARGVDEAAAVLLERQTSERREPAEYLVAGVHPARLLAVRSGAVEAREAAWLGDRGAFEIYQREYFRERGRPPPDFWESVAQAEDVEVASSMGNAMDAVVHGSHYAEQAGEQVLVTPRGGAIASVGEAAVSVVPRAGDGLFKYAEGNRAQSSGLLADLPPGLGVVPPDWGSAERGAFSYYMLIPDEPGVGALGIYFIEGQLGVLYAPISNDDPRVYRDMNVSQFIAAVRADHEITLTGLVPDDA